MTLIQPKQQKNFYRIIMGMMCLLLLVGIVSLIVVYNRTVDLQHGVVDMKSKFDKAQTANAELKDQVFAVLDGNHLKAFAEERSLVKDQKPQYVESSPRTEWALASHY